MHVALVNTNRIRPPIAPIGLDYVAEALVAAGHEVALLDLCWADEPARAIARLFHAASYDLVGLTLRNTDDCAFTSRQSFLSGFVEIVQSIRAHTDAPLVAGGVGFSTMPEQVLQLSGLQAGIWGDGEFALTEMARRLAHGQPCWDVPGLVWRREEGDWQRNPPAQRPLTELPAMSRSWVDNPRYYREGGQAGFETKRGCSQRCIYCADPAAKGRQIRPRPPQGVADEVERLLQQGISHLHTCDAEFNLPEGHAAAVCQEITRRGLGDRLRWYAYCSAVPFSTELARLMRRAGCVGINFGVDSGDALMLRRLRRPFGPDDILRAVHVCQQTGIAVMLDLLLGAPGETRGSLVRTIDLMRTAAPDRVGVAVGVRLYPGTPLAAQLQVRMVDGIDGDTDLCEPRFFLEPAVAPYIFEWLDEQIGSDPRFLFFDASRTDRNYNYNSNQRLVEAIHRGARGAYWDILRRSA